MAILSKTKNIYRALPSWVTAGARLVPDGLLFGASYRNCKPSVDCVELSKNIKFALEYSREHTMWGRENIPAGVSEFEAEEVLRGLPVIGSDEVAKRPELFVSDESSDIN